MYVKTNIDELLSDISKVRDSADDTKVSVHCTKTFFDSVQNAPEKFLNWFSESSSHEDQTFKFKGYLKGALLYCDIEDTEESFAVVIGTHDI